MTVSSWILTLSYFLVLYWWKWASQTLSLHMGSGWTPQRKCCLGEKAGALATFFLWKINTAPSKNHPFSTWWLRSLFLECSTVCLTQRTTSQSLKSDLRNLKTSSTTRSLSRPTSFLTLKWLREWLKQRSLIKQMKIENLKGKRLLWDLSALAFRFNVYFPRRIWLEIQQASSSRTANQHCCQIFRNQRHDHRARGWWHTQHDERGSLYTRTRSAGCIY